MIEPMSGQSKQEVGVAPDQAKSNDFPFIVWWVISILLLFVASVYAARPPINIAGYHDSALPIGAVYDASLETVDLTGNPDILR